MIATLREVNFLRCRAKSLPPAEKSKIERGRFHSELQSEKDWTNLGGFARQLNSSQQLLHHISVNVGEPEVAAGVAVCEAVHGQGRGDAAWWHGGRGRAPRLSYRAEAKLIRRTVSITAARASTSEPAGKAVMIVVAAIELRGIPRPGCGRIRPPTRQACCPAGRAGGGR